MRNDLADITLVVDRSGSMAGCKNDAEGGINTFIQQQKEAPGECNFTLIQFDTRYDFVHKGVPIKDVPNYTLVPLGNTALLDAVGRAIAEVGERLSNTPEDQRPGLVSFVIVTDGQENASKEYSWAAVKDAIEHQRTKYNWQFTFIGAGESAFTQGADMGVPLGNVVMSANPGNAYRGASSRNREMRLQASRGMAVDSSYSADERQAMS